MIRRHILNYKINKLIKKQSAEAVEPREIPSSGRVGIILTSFQQNNFDKITAFKTRLKEEGMEVHVLCQALKGARATGIPFNFFEESDFSLFGNPKSGMITDFTEREYSFLFYTDLVFNPFVDYIIAASKAICKVGVNNHERPDLFSLILHTKIGNWDVILEDMYKYKNMVHNYEQAI